MAEGFKTRRGGGTSKQPFGVLTANFPSGTVTVSNGSISFTATSSPALFTIPEAGTWTATAVDGSKRASKSVTVSTQGEVVSVTLVYEVDLYNAGDECTSVTGGWSLAMTGVSWAEKLATSIYLNNDDSQYCYIYTGKAINMANYSVLNVGVSDAWAGNYGHMYIDVGDGAARMESTSTGSRTYTLDVSAVTSGVVKVGVQGHWSDDMNQKSTFGMDVIRIWLS